ncbi:4-hydroxyacetophenone monooxygenase [Sistotremastrum niveocremeum HHB9708]|uniref:4-hydroxyacetophenone monooxygenase n=1 Tax=Sistotremastrum niveocremeum HHB9708 TaxID=1314777 RepID=A0A164U4B2_9AGAM|nr:4-hydroxyacetophenone monooxygenase [Sistotremastrum niveocremeum HHB9708]
MESYSTVVCIGAGISGICLGAQLQRQLGSTDIHIYDRNPDLGGTWWSNKYPGVACDVPTPLYSFSFEQNPSWSRFMASGDEIHAYIKAVAYKYDLPSRMTFNTECEGAEWDERTEQWTVYLRHVQSGRTSVHRCKLFIAAAGILVDPKDFKVPGLHSFKGSVVHTARWDTSLDLSDKNVVVIGNGCSATQFIPAVVSKVRSLTQFIQDPQWLVERRPVPYTPQLRWCLKNVPLLLRFQRLMIFNFYEGTWPLFYLNEKGQKARAQLAAACTQWRLKAAPEKYREILAPPFDVACKRRIIDTDYFKALHEPKVNLVQEKIQETLGKMKIKGRTQTIDEHWKEFGGPEAYNTTALHGFPNFGIVWGPNAVTGHNSAIFTIENAVNYILKVYKPVIEGEATTVEVKAQAEKDEVLSMQRDLKERVWVGCKSWYNTDSGWNGSTYPWSQVYFWWRSIFPKWNDWEIKQVKVWHRIIQILSAIL